MNDKHKIDQQTISMQQKRVKNKQCKICPLSNSHQKNIQEALQSKV